MTKKRLQQDNANNIRAQELKLLSDYIKQIAPTDRLPKDDLRPVLLGLFGEIGSVMATAKKLHREKEAYAGYQHAVVEEFGDTLWYFAALCRRLGSEVDEILSEAVVCVSGSQIVDEGTQTVLEELLLMLGEAAAALLSHRDSGASTHELLSYFLVHYFQAVRAARVPFANIVSSNTDKVQGRFLEPDTRKLPTLDNAFPPEEQLPKHFEIKIAQRKIGQSYLQMNGVFIGDPLTDNIPDPDGFRFHDVFHLAHAAILHWSPTFRALIKQKRKSDPAYDEAQDGGRAIVVEEGLTAWILSCVKDLNFFEGQASVSLDILKTVQQFVRGYEAERCPLKLWEDAILEGYKVFRLVRQYNGGFVIGDRNSRSIEFKPISGDNHETSSFY